MRKKGLNTIYELAKENKNIIFLGSDLGPDVLSDFKNELPEQFFMEGISEGHIIGMASGLAADGNIVYVNTIATFLTRRCFDQIAINLCHDKRKVRLYANGGGLVYGPLGPTHIAVDDIALMRTLPNMSIICPCDEVEMRELIRQTVNHENPLYIRLAKGGDAIITEASDVKFGQARFHSLAKKNTNKILLVTTGIMHQRGLELAELLNSSAKNADLINYNTIIPFDDKCLLERVSDYDFVFTLEEHQKSGGLGEMIAHTLLESGKTPKVFKSFHLGDHYPDQYGRQEKLLEIYGLEPRSLYDKIISIID